MYRKVINVLPSIRKTLLHTKPTTNRPITDFYYVSSTFESVYEFLRQCFHSNTHDKYMDTFDRKRYDPKAWSGDSF